MSTQDVQFRVDTQLLDELGKRLVTEDYVALAELIKNAYDADATRVTVQITTKGSHQKIVISDNGNGMTFEEVERRWMRVATSEKLENPTSPRFGRAQTGSKGIGRFAVLRLSDHLRLTAKGRVGRSVEQTTISFDWDDLRRGRELADLHFKANVSKPTGANPGLELDFSSLSKRWTGSDVLHLRRDLADLVGATAVDRGKPYEPDPGFEVFIRSDSDGAKVRDELSLGEQMLDAGWGRLSGSLDSRGEIWKLKLKAKFLPEVDWEIPGPTSLRHLRSKLTLDLSWYPQKAIMWSERTLATRKALNEFLKQRAGVKIYLNSARVYPYGQEGDDWLRLEHVQASRLTRLATEDLSALAVKLNVAQHRPMLDHPRAQRLIGRVDIHQGPKGTLTPTTDRMGFNEDEAFIDLRHLVQQSVQWMTLHYTRAKLKASEAKAKRLADKSTQSTSHRSVELELNEIETSLGAVGRAVTLSGPEKEVVRDAAQSIALTAQAQTARAEVLEQTASAAGLLFVFSHEAFALLGSASGVAALLQDSSGVGAKERLSVAGRHIEEMTTGLRGLLELVGLVVKGARESAPKAQPVDAAVMRAMSAFQAISRRYSVELLAKISPQLTTPPMRPAAFTSVLINALSNALKAVLATDAPRRIRIEGHAIGNGVSIRIMDNGIGLHKQYWSVVFEPLVSDPGRELYSRLDRVLTDDSIREFARGSGLGLSIIQSIVSRAGGTVQFISPSKGWATCLEVILP